MPGKAGHDLNLRQPMDWAAVTAQSGQPDSILSWCRYLIKARALYPALRGDYATLATDLGPTKALACIRTAGEERVVVVANLTAEPATVVLTDPTAHGVPPGAAMKPILGDPGANQALAGSTYTATAIPPYGVRIYHATGGTFQGSLHGDRQ